MKVPPFVLPLAIMGNEESNHSDNRDNNLSMIPPPPSYVALMDAAWEPGLLVDAASGTLLHWNDAAARLFLQDNDKTSSSSTLLLSKGEPVLPLLFSQHSNWKEAVNQVQTNKAAGISNSKSTSAVLECQLSSYSTLSNCKARVTLLSTADTVKNNEENNVSSKDSPQLYAIFLNRLPDQERTTTATTTSPSANDDNNKDEIGMVHGLLDASMDPVFQIDSTGIILMVNEAAVQQFGYTKTEFLGHNISMIVGVAHAARHDQYLRTYLETGVTQVMGKKRELSARRKDGTEFPMELGLAEINTMTNDHSSHDDHTHRLFCGFVRDLTHQKRDQEELERREALVMGMLDASMDPLLQIDDKGIIQMANEAAIAQFGYSHDEFIGRNISMIVGSEHAKHHDSYIERYLRTGEKRVMGTKRELVAQRKDGTEFPMELGLAEVQVQGERRFCGFIRDLTKQKQDEALVLGMLEASLDPLLQIDDQGIIQMANQAAIAQFGYIKEEFIGSNINIIVGGGHAPNHDSYLKRYMETGEKHVMGTKRELSARRKDGSEFPIELGLAEIEYNGLRRFCGFVHDLTRRKQDENELKRREAFTNSIIEAAHDALFVTDGMESIIRVNAASTELFGWSRQELEGMTLNQLLAPKYAAEQRAEIARYIKEGAPLKRKRKVEGIRKDGTLFPLLLGTSDVEGPSGQNLFALFSLDMSDHEKMLKIEIEKKASDVLLKNVLPDQIAERLKLDPTTIAEHHESATILFADIVGFTAMSSKMLPSDLVHLLNELFIMFDELVDKYDLNKIKTIGDCYMCSSVPVVEHEDHECERVCHFALDMLDALKEFNERYPEHKLNLRVGINEGPVVAGVVGTKRFAFDLWGDSVNTASRMESTAVVWNPREVFPGKIQVTKAVVELAKDSFEFESRGNVHVKGKGKMEAFVLLRRKKDPRFSVKFLAKQELLRLQRELTPDLSMIPESPHGGRGRRRHSMLDDLKGSVSEISNSVRAYTSMADFLVEEDSEDNYDE